ncbi:MAG: hypothetical protein QXZ64_05960 [Candidatus Bathyarchaeia archaeon]
MSSPESIYRALYIMELVMLLFITLVTIPLKFFTYVAMRLRSGSN